ncbi:hypothetical protein CLOM_g19869 [Closterium sp. NIES-68]|nr:hypothetical protein CLOM_g19869 [Closterium sp. NIES-68]GJP67605.1 hypothetical protein CLOP_g24407 [Closterium sp. NIES-67]
MWLSYYHETAPLGMGSWNVSGSSPGQSAAAAAVATVDDRDGSPLVYDDKLVPSKMVADIRNQMVVYQIEVVLFPYDMTALGGASQSGTVGQQTGTAAQPSAGSRQSGASLLTTIVGLVVTLLLLTLAM